MVFDQLLYFPACLTPWPGGGLYRRLLLGHLVHLGGSPTQGGDGGGEPPADTQGGVPARSLLFQPARSEHRDAGRQELREVSLQAVQSTGHMQTRDEHQPGGGRRCASCSGGRHADQRGEVAGLRLGVWLPWCQSVRASFSYYVNKLELIC